MKRYIPNFYEYVKEARISDMITNEDDVREKTKIDYLKLIYSGEYKLIRRDYDDDKSDRQIEEYSAVPIDYKLSDDEHDVSSNYDMWQFVPNAVLRCLRNGVDGVCFVR